MDAGLKLYGINPNNAPPKIAVIIAVSYLLFIIDITNSVAEAIKPIPAESPSNPSIKLKAFVTPIIHKIVNGIDKKPTFKNNSLLVNGLVIKLILIPNIINTMVPEIGRAHV